ncbi:MAG TPA: CAP domain-containing protein [Candidatus Elarobacter sp.]|jgi:uncharacterized protein YkwD|nr:CAP domain-containing protein [Candidatus Elarobacter sp.]
MQNVLRSPVLWTSRIKKAAPLASLAALLLAMTPFAVRGPFVSASQDWGERPIAIALVNPHPHADPTAAAELADGVNAERAKRGLPPLVRDAALDKVAYAKAVDMAARGYFGHTDPNGVTFAERMQAWHWPTVYVAENIAFDSSEQHAQTAFVNSPEHYSNQVDPHEREIGVAVITVGRDETFYVEDFSG